MKKPQLSLALSVSVALAQASLLTAQAAPSASIWQKMSQAPAKSAVHAPVHATAKAKVATRTNKVSAPATKNQHVALTPAANADGQAMLFLMGKNKQTGGSVAPAAALTIHPQVSQDAAAEVSTAGDTSEQNLVAVNNAAGELPQTAASAVAAKPLFTMLAPDRPAVAQGDVQVTPIPPVVTGTVDLEEFKSTNILDLKVSQSRTFKLKNKIVRTSISDPSIAEPVVVSENQIVLLGKAPGGATLVPHHYCHGFD